MTPLILAALVALGALVLLGVLARGATAQQPSSGNGAARFDALRELNNKLSRAIKTLDRKLPLKGSTIKDTEHWTRTLNDLEATKLRAVNQFPSVFGLPYGETFGQLSCIDDEIAVGKIALLELQKGYVTGAFKGRFFASRLVLENLLRAKACKDALETELGSGTGVPSGVIDDLRELSNKLTRAIDALDQELPLKGSTIKDTARWTRTLNDLEATKLRAVDQFPEILDPPYGETFIQLSCIDEEIAVGKIALLELDKGYVTGAFKGRFFASRLVLENLMRAKACKDTLETQLMDSFNLKPSAQTEVGVNPTTPNGTDTQNPNKLNAPKTLEHAYAKDGFIGRHEQDYVMNGVNSSNPDSWPSGRSVLFLDVFDLFGSSSGAQNANQASQQNLKSSGFTPIQDSSLGPGESVFQHEAANSSVLNTIIYVQRGTFIMKIAGACNGCSRGSIDPTLMSVADLQLDQGVLMGFPGPAPSGPLGSGPSGSGGSGPGSGGGGAGGSGGGGGTSPSASGSLTNGSGTILNYSIQTNTTANAFELILPSGLFITGTTFPSGFTCNDAGNVETCKGGRVQPNTPVTGSFDHTGTIAANCDCIRLQVSNDGGLSWDPNLMALLAGPPSSSGGSGGGTQPLTASIINPTGNATFLDGSLGGGTTAGLQVQGQISGGTAPYTATIDWGDGTTATGSNGMHAYPATTSLTDGKMPYPLSFDVSDSAGHTTSAAATITILCAGITGAGFTADLGAGSTPTIVFCGHWTGGFVPATVLYMPASGQSWQFSGFFNLFESHQTCPNPTTTLVGSCQPKNASENPTLHFGGAFNINAPVASGMKITAEGEDAMGKVIQTFTGTVP